MLTLKNFEKVVEKKIVERGFGYYEYGQVEEVERVDRYEFAAVVQGSEEYEVFIKLDRAQRVVEHYCDCPYDWGDVCKHEVAVLYYIRDAELHKQPAGESPVLKAKEEISRLPKKELVDAVVWLMKRNRSARRDLLDYLELVQP